MEAARNNDVESMKVVGRGLNVNAKNVVSTAPHKHERLVPFLEE